jgi:hypothetical protein
MSSLFKSILGVAAPIVGNLIAPGIGGILGGALGGAAQGNGLKGIAMGAGSAALSNGLGSVLGAPSSTINWTSAAPGYSLGSQTVGGSGLLGSLSKAGGFGQSVADGISKATSAAGGGASLAKAAGNIFSGIQGDEAMDDIARVQNAGTQNALDAQKPFLASGVAANSQLSGLLGLNGENNDDVLEMLRNSPGYQFRLNEGQDALNKSLSARGGLFSGRALKESQELGQGLADQTYKDYINQLYGLNSSGQNAANVAGGLYQDQGNIQANKISGQNNVLNESISGILNGIYNPTGTSGKIIGYDTQGKPIYQ